MIATQSSILSIQGISKFYGNIQALKNVSFTVPEGSVFGVLGPNGSGKTTLLGILLDVLVANAGTYQWMGGTEPHIARRQIGALLETPNFYHYLSAVENLTITAAIKQRGKEDIHRALEIVGLTERKDSKFSTYSLGMKQRLAIGAALMDNPKILVLDEPTNGLDPAGIAEIRELIRKLNNEGITVVMASHLLDEVEKVCTHVAILKRGDLLLHGAVDEVLRSEDQIEVRAANMQVLQQALQSMDGIQKTQLLNNTLLLSFDTSISPEKVNEYCAAKGITLSHLLLKKKSLESKFIELTN